MTKSYQLWRNKKFWNDAQWSHFYQLSHTNRQTHFCQFRNSIQPNQLNSASKYLFHGNRPITQTEDYSEKQINRLHEIRDSINLRKVDIIILKLKLKWLNSTYCSYDANSTQKPNTNFTIHCTELFKLPRQSQIHNWLIQSVSCSIFISTQTCFAPLEKELYHHLVH